MAATLLPTLSPPVSRAAAAFLLRRAPLKPSHYLHPPPTLRRLLSSSSYPATPSIALCPLSTMPSTTAARAVPARRDLLMLGIETSCDDTAAAVVRGDGEILSQVVSSQVDLLARYGGVAPKMAEEAHALVIDQVVQKALYDAKLSESDLSAVAVTIGPGLSLCLRVGVHKARQVAKAFGLPIVGVHHMEAHALVSRLVNKDLDFPFLALLISGGHNLLVLARGLGQYIQLGTTIDDAIGEAYDKSARWLGLDIRKGGGPALEELALEGDPNAVKFKVPMRQYKDCNFSYAGLKTQVRLAIESKNLCTEDVPISSALEEDRQSRANIAASFQRVAVLHLEERCQRAVEWALKMESSIKYFVVSGGVASNKYVRTRLNQVAENNGLQLVSPPPSLCTDNGVMIAWTGIEHFVVGRFEDPPADDEPDDMQAYSRCLLTGESQTAFTIFTNYFPIFFA
ncbi:probable tRNA N6-adenosine threonylcarbamoyltransferase, mitochondrial isoform X2 [Miscanthus floridulus]|uniref:probable tRNA N6-adenosine threonylcarbamoyltransferase, mitochondrial isoform X2 n=1 Tax=Miscanthus floridulus TaxID=154761 RepID=UPI00345A6D12